MSSLELLEEGVCYDRCILLAKLLAIDLIHFVLQGQSRLSLQVSLDFLLLQSPIMKRTSFGGVSSRRFVGLHRTVQLSFFSVTGWGRDLDNCDIEWLALETNRDHSVLFEIASKYCILDSFVNCEVYSISSKGFLPTIVDIIII